MKAFAGADRRSGAHEKYESSGFHGFLPQEMKELKNEKMKASLVRIDGVEHKHESSGFLDFLGFGAQGTSSNFNPLIF